MKRVKKKKIDPADRERVRGLQLEVRRLRSLAKEIASRYVQKLEGRASEILSLLSEAGEVDKKTGAALLRKIRDLNVKPQKGRRKDLARLEDLVKDLHHAAAKIVEEKGESS